MRLAFFAPHAYPAISSTARGNYGGLETHAWELAQGCAATGEADVTFVVEHRHRFKTRLHHGVNVVNAIDPRELARSDFARCVDLTADYPWFRIRSLTGHLPLAALRLCVARAFRTTGKDVSSENILPEDAEVCCAFGVNAAAADMIRCAKVAGQRTVLFLESNDDLNPQFETDPSFVNQYGVRADDARFALRNAEVIISQSEWQQRRLNEMFGRDSSVLRNPIDLSRWKPAEVPDRDRNEQPYVLWIGRTDRFHKRPELCLRIAESLPHLEFLMVMGVTDKNLERELKAKAPRNVSFTRSVPYDEIHEIFQKSRLFLSTSSNQYEGSPNVFLQAAACGVPTVSLEVDAEFVEMSRSGVVCQGDLTRCVREIDRLWTDDERRDRFARNGIDYVREHHAREVICRQFLELLKETE